MKNYKDSDYAINKYNEGIVYQFTDSKVVISLEDYLKENPTKTAIDFTELKKISDEIYLEQVTKDHKSNRFNITINGLENSEKLTSTSLELALIQKEGEIKIQEIAKQLLKSGALTTVQQRRFILYFIEGKSLREIAVTEGVCHKQIWKSIKLSNKKLKKLFEIGGTICPKNDIR